MVVHDLLGISCLEKPPKFVKNFMEDSSSIEAIKSYVTDVKIELFHQNITRLVNIDSF